MPKKIQRQNKFSLFFFLSVLALTMISAVNARATDLTQFLGVRLPSQNTASSYGYGNELPGLPSNIFIDDRNENHVMVFWDPPAQDVTFYTIRYGLTSSTKKKKKINGNQDAAVLLSLKSNRQYYLKIKATNNSGDSGYSEIITFRTKPEKVTNVRYLKKKSSASSAYIKWRKVDGGSTNYRLMIKKNGEILRYVMATKTHRLIKNLKARTRYKIKVQANHDADTKGEWSEVVSVKTKS